MIPLTLFALRRGLKPALMAAFIWGILHFPASQVVYLSVVQVLIEYPIAFTFAGFAGLYAKNVQKALSERDMRSVRRNIVFRNLYRNRSTIFLAFYRWRGVLGKLCFMGNESMDIFSCYEWS